MKVLLHVLGAVIIGYIGIYYGNSLMMALCLAWILFPIIGLILAWYFSRHVKVELEAVQPIADWGQKVSFRLTAENPTWIYGASVWARLEYGHDYDGDERRRKVFLRLKAKERQAVVIECQSDLVGLVHCRVRSYQVGDPFGWFRLSRHDRREGRIAVLPKEYPCFVTFEEKEEQPGEEEVYMTHLRGENPEEVFQVREYQAGDRIRNIHWKLSARAEEWIVRDFVHPGQCRLALLADLAMPQGQKTEGLNEVLAVLLSLGLAILRMQETFWLVWRDEDRDGLQRIFVENEEGFYEGILQMYQAKLVSESTAIEDLYRQLYEEELCISVNRKGELLVNGQCRKRFRPETIESQLKKIYL